MKKFQDLRKVRVQNKPCSTCPFDGIESNFSDIENYHKSLCGLEAQHLCHTAENRMICRGGRNIQLRILYSLGWIDEPTDEAFLRATCEALENRQL